MEICNENHDDIAFEGRYCPLCSTLDDLAKANEKIEEMGDEQK